MARSVARVALVHWKEAELAARLQWLDAAGARAIRLPLEETPILRALREDPPDLLVISLERSPSGGREVARRARLSPKTRHVPVVFVGGAADKVGPLLELFPQDVFTDGWEEIGAAIREALAIDPQTLGPPGERPPTPLPAKLGVEPGMRVFVRGGELPGIKGVSRLEGSGLAVVFVRSRSELERLFAEVDAGWPHLWVCSPKKAGSIAADFTQDDVRRVGLAAGWVDYKVCAVDADWSGLKFAPP